MPITKKKCPDCDGWLHTDDLIERECVTPGCGAELPEEIYDDVIGFYTPESINNA